MGVRYHVRFFRDVDGPKFHKMLKAKAACKEAGVGYPALLKDYFKSVLDSDGNFLYSDSEVRDQMSEIHPSKDLEPEIELSGDSSGFEIRTKDLPEDCSKIRFEISY